MGIVTPQAASVGRNGMDSSSSGGPGSIGSSGSVGVPHIETTAGVMLSALWVASTGQLVLIVHHLAVDGVSWRIVLEDLNIA